MVRKGNATATATPQISNKVVKYSAVVCSKFTSGREVQPG